MEIKYVIVKNKDGTAVKRLSNVKDGEIILKKMYSEIEEIVSEEPKEEEEEEEVIEESFEEYNEDELFGLNMKKLKKIGKKFGVKDNKKADLVNKILGAQ